MDDIPIDRYLKDVPKQLKSMENLGIRLAKEQQLMDEGVKHSRTHLQEYQFDDMKLIWLRGADKFDGCRDFLVRFRKLCGLVTTQQMMLI